MPGRVLRPGGARHVNLGCGDGENSVGSPRHQRTQESLRRGLLFVQNSGIKCTCGGGLTSAPTPITNLVWEV